MKSIINILYFAAGAALLSACGADDLDSKKTKLSELRTEASSISTQISQLEREISQLDPEFGKNDNNIILVTTTNIQPQFFEHKIEVRGTVESRKNVMVSAEIGGRIATIKVIEGQSVKKGEVLLSLDADIIRNNIAELHTSLELAKIVFERQSNLWNQKIGTEIQYLESKNKNESLERKLTTAKSQLAQATVRAPFSGSVDQIPVKVGEMATPGSPLIRIVNPNDMYIKSDVSETYIGKFKKGESVEVHFPSQNKDLISKISSVGQVINRNNRTFDVEIELSEVDFVLKPNQVSVLKMTDYINESAYSVPTKLIQRDNKGTFVYGAMKKDNTLVAKKIHVETGLSFNSRTEITAGLQGNEIMIVKGFRDVTEGVEVKVSTAQK